MTIFLSQESKKNLRKISIYLASKFGRKTKDDFLNDVDEVLGLLLKNPYMGKSYQNNIYLFVVVKQVTLYYRIENKVIYIITFFDNRQNPEKLNELLN